MAQLTTWLTSVAIAALPTGAIIWQMTQQGEGLRQQIVAIQNQSHLMEEQIRLEEQRIAEAAAARQESQRLQAITFVAQHIDIIDQGSPIAQRQLARLLTQSFPPEVACPFVEDWIHTSTSLDHWRALRDGAQPCVIVEPDPVAPAEAPVVAAADTPTETAGDPAAAGAAAEAEAAAALEAGGCGLIFLHYVDGTDQEKARAAAATLRQEGCEVRGPTLAVMRSPGVYGPSAGARARADQLRTLLRRYQEVFVRDEGEAALEIILPNL